MRLRDVFVISEARDTQHMAPHPEVPRKFFREQSGVSVYLVDGTYVRDHVDVDFTMGGHWLVYGYVPEGEVWIDRDLSEKDREMTVDHEITELRKMQKGEGYDRAHDETNDVERHERSTYGDDDREVAEDGWQRQR